MNLIKVAIIMKMKFSEFYDVKKYITHPSEQLVVKRYNTHNRKITINEEK